MAEYFVLLAALLAVASFVCKSHRSHCSLSYSECFLTLRVSACLVNSSNICIDRESVLINIAMVDVLGTAASVIAIAQVVLELIKHAKTFYRAQAEFDVLQVSLKML
jgi:hypothetical protein